MSTDIRVVDWYRNRIHERQRKANTLSIEVELNARDKEDLGALAEAMNCLDSAITELEKAKDGLADTGEPIPLRPLRGQPRAIPEFKPEESGELMEDLGHSMTSLDVRPIRPRPEAHVRSGGRRVHPHVVEMRRTPFENSLNFFQ